MNHEQAAEYIQRGYGVCRIRPGEKRPTYKQWNLASLSAEAFEPGDNIGLLTGQLSGNLVCVDLYSPEALRLADQYLPPTGMVDGRPSKPRSHRWYKVVDIPPELTSHASGGIGGPKLKRFKRADNGQSILDFLGTGGQAVVPPSLHESGERRDWHENGEPAVLPMMKLWEAVCALATECGWESSKSSGKGGPPLRERVRQGKRFIQKAPLARSGHGGHDTTFYVARRLVHDLALPSPIGRRLLDQYNERLVKAGLEPWTPEELDHKWESAGDHLPDSLRGGQAGPALQKPANDPHRLAREFIDTRPWVYWHGMYFEYDTTKYVEVPEAEVRARLNGHIKERLDSDYERQVREDAARTDPFARRALRPPTPLSVTTSLTRNTLQALESLALQPSTVRMPSCLSSGQTPNWLALSNGLLDLDSGQRHPHTPDWFSTVCLPYRHDPQAQCQQWLTMLQQNLEGDSERIALLQEFFGYCLIPSTDAQACLVLVGEGGNGKSVVLLSSKASDSDIRIERASHRNRRAMSEGWGRGPSPATRSGTLSSLLKIGLTAVVC